MSVKFPTQRQLEKMQKLNREIKNRGGNVKVVPKVNKKINEKINKESNYKTELAKSGVGAKYKEFEMEQENRARREFGIPKQETKKINSNPIKGKTVIGPLARGAGSGGIAGLALGAISAYKQELADLARRKREIS